MAEEGRNVIGEILRKSPNEIEWKIPDFFLLTDRKDPFLKSPPFPYLYGTWCLGFNPKSSFRGIVVGLTRIHSTSNHYISFRLGIKLKDGSEYNSFMKDKVFNYDGEEDCVVFSADWKYLRARMTSVFCVLPIVSNQEAASQTIRSEVKDVTTETSDGDFSTSQKRFEDDSGASQELKGTSEYTEENTAGSFKEVGEDDDTKLEFTTKIGVTSLVQSFKDLLTREEQCDILVKVKDKEFKAHKLILGARSSVFSAMFAHDTSEKRTNIVEITDCEPDAFMQFLIFLYTGQVEKVPGDQVIDLYIIADKYNVEELKEECVNFIKDHITIETFCDVMSLALSHNEMALIESATEYFVENVKEIIVTAKWITFLQKNPVESNELHIKTLNYGNKK